MAVKRSSKWRKFERLFLADKVCAACGTETRLTAHHIIPFSMAPSLELDRSNLIALCDGLVFRKKKCHFNIGHRGNWKSFNLSVREDAAKLLRAIKTTL